MQQWICHIKGLESVFGAREVERVGRQIDGVDKLIVDYAGETLVLSAASRDVLKRLEIRLGRLGYKLLDKGYTVISVIAVGDLLDKRSQEYIQKKIGAHTFVQNLDIRPLSESIILTHSADFSIADFICDLNNQGIKAALVSQQLGKSFWKKFSGIFTILSILLFLSGVVLSLFLDEEYYSLAAFASSIVFSLPVLVLKAGRQIILEKKFNYELLLVLIAGYSFAIGHWFEVAFIGVCYVLLQQRELKLSGLLRELWSKIRSQELAVAFVKNNGNRVAVLSSELAAGHVINVQAGEIVPVDGVIVSGEGLFTEKYLSGSSRQTPLGVDETVYAGMNLVNGEVDLRLSSTHSKSMSSLMYRQLEAMQTQITGFQTRIKKYSEYFLYISTVIFSAIILSILLMDAGFPDLWLDKSLSLMLVSSATFIVVSIQYSYLFSYVIAARDGLYFFRPDYWRHLSGIDTVILDKNGVVTCDEPEVQEVISLSDYAIKDVLRVAASLSQAGNESRFYPVRKRAEQHNVILDDVLETNVVKGKSISGKINGQVYRIGSQSVFEDAGLITSEINQKLKRWQEEGANIILLADESRIFGMVTIVDPVRDEVSEFIDCAHEKLGLKVVMLSHDNVGTSQVLANRYGFDDVVSEITDDGKEQAIENYTRSHSVLLISNRHDLVVDEKNRISLVNDALKSRYIEGDKAIVSLGVRLLSVLNLIATARKVEVRLKRILYVVGVAKLLIVTGIVAGFLSLGTVVGLEFLLGFWVLFSTYVPSRELKVKKIDRKSAFT